MKQPLRNLIGWSVAATVVSAVLQIAQLAVVARLIGPAAVGIVAIFNVFVSFSWLLQDFGFSGYLVHRQHTTAAEEKCLFATTVIIGMGMAALLGTSGPFVADFYGEKILGSLLSLLSINVVLMALFSQFQAITIRRMDLDLLAKIEIMSRILGFLVLILLLLIGLGLLAVGLALITVSVAKGGLLIGFNRGHLSRLIHGSWDRLIHRPALNYGMYQVGAQLVNQLRTQADVLIFGKLVGLELAGLYALAKELVLKPGRLIQPVVARVTLPWFANLQADPVKQVRSYRQSLELSSLINGVIYIGIIVLAAPLVFLLYGEKYTVVAALIPILAPFGLLRTLGAPTAALAQANARTYLDFRWNIIASVFLIAVLMFAANWSLTEMALGVSSLQAILTLASYFCFVKPLSNMIFVEFLSTWLWTASAVAGVALMAAIEDGKFDPAVALIGTVFCFAQIARLRHQIAMMRVTPSVR